MCSSGDSCLIASTTWRARSNPRSQGAPTMPQGTPNAQMAGNSAEDVELDLRFTYDSADPALHQNPLPYFKSLLAGPPIFITRRGIKWAVIARYHDAQAVLRDHKRFSSVNPQLPG